MKKPAFNIQIFSDLVSESDCGISLPNLLMNLECNLVSAYLNPDGHNALALISGLSLALDLSYSDMYLFSKYLSIDFNGRLVLDTEYSNLYLCMVSFLDNNNILETLYLNLISIYKAKDLANLYAPMLIALAKSLHISRESVLKLANYLATSGIKPYN